MERVHRRWGRDLSLAVAPSNQNPMEVNNARIPDLHHPQPSPMVFLPVTILVPVPANFFSAPPPTPAPPAAGRRFCHRCGVTETPLWRKGPRGSKTLCNACGLSFWRRKRAFARRFRWALYRAALRYYNRA